MTTTWHSDWGKSLVFNINMQLIHVQSSSTDRTFQLLAAPLLRRAGAQNASLQRRLLGLQRNNRPLPPPPVCLRLWRSTGLLEQLLFCWRGWKIALIKIKKITASQCGIHVFQIIIILRKEKIQIIIAADQSLEPLAHSCKSLKLIIKWVQRARRISAHYVRDNNRSTKTFSLSKSSCSLIFVFLELHSFLCTLHACGFRWVSYHPGLYLLCQNTEQLQRD